jgi:hypothetical protein
MRMLQSAHAVFEKNAYDERIVPFINASTYFKFYSDTFKNTANYYYGKKKFRISAKFFWLSFFLHPFQFEVTQMLLRSLCNTLTKKEF